MQNNSNTNGWDVLKTLILTIFRFVDRGHFPALVLLLVFAVFAYHCYQMPTEDFFAMCRNGLAKSLSSAYLTLTVVVGTYVAIFFACRHLMSVKDKEIDRLAKERDELKRLLKIKMKSSGHRKRR